MSSCEKCWAEAGGDADRYAALVKVRECTPEEQAGPDAKWCPDCGRMTLHQHTGECMAGCDVETYLDEVERHGEREEHVDPQTGFVDD